MVTRKARCCCGSLSVETLGEPVLNGLCHCDNCKRRTGGAFGWSAYFPEAAIGAIDGASTAYVFDSASGRQERNFCPSCGSTVYWRSAVFPGVIGVAGGCLEGSPLGEPTLSASDARRCAWLELPASWVRSP